MVVVDACSVILLAKSSVLEEFTKLRKLIIPEMVYEEIMQGKGKKLLDALLTEKLVNEGKIIIKGNINRAVVQKLTNDFGLGKGEAEAVTLALESDDKIIITDNKQGRKASNVYGLHLAGSIEVVITLYKLKRISKEKAKNALRSLKSMGWFQDYLIEKALEDIQDE